MSTGIEDYNEVPDSRHEEGEGHGLVQGLEQLDTVSVVVGKQLG